MAARSGFYSPAEAAKPIGVMPRGASRRAAKERYQRGRNAVDGSRSPGSPASRAAAKVRRMNPLRIERSQLRRLEMVLVAETSTLLLLLFIAVPLKHVAHWPLAVTVMGPVHGLAFLVYLWTVLQTVAGGGWRAAEIARLIVFACIPLGGLISLRTIRRKRAALDAMDGNR